MSGNIEDKIVGGMNGVSDFGTVCTGIVFAGP
jgi:hypothetical protein